MCVVATAYLSAQILAHNLALAGNLMSNLVGSLRVSSFSFYFMGPLMSKRAALALTSEVPLLRVVVTNNYSEAGTGPAVAYAAVPLVSGISGCWVQAFFF